VAGAAVARETNKAVSLDCRKDQARLVDFVVDVTSAAVLRAVEVAPGRQSVNSI
jgi:hypothetical protein